MKKTPKGARLLERIPDPRNPGKLLKPRLRSARAAKPPLLVPIAPPGTRAHLVDSLLFAIENRDALTALVAGASTRTAARRSLVRHCRMSSTQAEAILDLRWWQFTRKSHREWELELRASVR